MARTRSLLAACFPLLLACPVAAQAQFVVAGQRGCPADAMWLSSAATLDFDGNGTVDLAIGIRGGVRDGCQLWSGDGHGTFTALGFASGLDRPSDIRAIDIDRDGRTDLLLANAGPDRLLHSGGGGSFTTLQESDFPGGPGGSVAIDAADLDGDGDLDVCIANPGVPNRILIQYAPLRFRAESRLPPEGADMTMRLLPADIDGDGDSDLIVARAYIPPAGRPSAIYLNDGKGFFTDATAGRWPASAASVWTVLAGDVDQDGDVDLFLDWFSAPGMGVVVLRNDGTGRFTDVTQTSLPPLTDRFGACVLADVNGDGQLDLLGQRAVLLGDGRGKFALAPGFLPDWGDSPAAVAVADFDKDSHVDLFLGNERTPSRVALNPAGQGFVSLRQDAIHGLAPLPSELLAFAEDFDGDGNLDVFASPLRPNPSITTHVFLGDGRLAFRVPAPPLPPATPGLGLAIVGAFDADGDRRPELVTASATSLGLWHNLGAGRFVDESTRLPSNAIGFGRRPQALAIDVDRDGDRDLVAADLWTASLWLNDGRGRFTDATAGRLPPGASSSLLAGDLDEDGDTDLLGMAFVLLNDGKGSFSDKAGALPFARYWSFLGDLDGDGHLDAMADGTLILGDGTGRFTDRTAGHLPPTLRSVIAVADVDRDGDFDAFAGGSLFLNDGHAVFFDATDRRLGPFVPWGWPLVLGDFDQDGDVDYLANYGRFYAIVNRHTQTELPFLPRTGRPFRFECFVRPGYDSATPLVLPLLSAGTARLPLPPFGTLLVDPLRLVTLPPATTKSNTGSARWTFSLPPDPALTGSELATQALVLPDLRAPATWQLGNGTMDVIWR